jgi:hypothetical protein
MRFGGHETFSIREGWLFKGLKLLSEKPECFQKDDLHEVLGVGSNMAKSIRHWITATGLAEVGIRLGKKKNSLSTLKMTKFGSFILKNDPYMIEPGTWWALHINIVTNTDHAIAWGWFFSHLNQIRFDRGRAIEEFNRYLRTTSQRAPSPKTLERDMACLLQTYARRIPASIEDPEDSKECPFLELGLVSFSPGSGEYTMNRGAKTLAPEIWLYALAKAFGESGSKNKWVEVSLQRVATEPNSPGMLFQLSSDRVFESLQEVEAQDERVKIVGMAGERNIRFENLEPYEMLGSYYSDKKLRAPKWHEAKAA